MMKRVIFLTATFLLASFITACTTAGNVGDVYRGTAVERAR